MPLTRIVRKKNPLGDSGHRRTSRRRASTAAKNEVSSDEMTEDTTSTEESALDRRKARIEQKRAMPNRQKSLHKIVADKFKRNDRKSSLFDIGEDHSDNDKNEVPEQAPSSPPPRRRDFAKALQMGRSLTCVLNDMGVGGKERRAGRRRSTVT